MSHILEAVQRAPPSCRSVVFARLCRRFPTRENTTSSLAYTASVYTDGVEFDGFDWDVANVEHILRHEVSPFEVEEAVSNPHLLAPAAAVASEERHKLFGKAGRRYLVVVFTIRRGKFRTVTAYTMNTKERKLYGSQID